MTDNEIVKALECCGKTSSCDGCPLREDTKHCTPIISINALSLINRQKAEIERLGKDSKRLKKVQMQLDDAMKMYSTIKAEAIKEFAKKFKRKSVVWRIDNFDMGYQITDDEFDNLVKEMVGENNAE